MTPLHDPRSAEAKVRGMYRRRDEAGRRRLYDPVRAENVAWDLTRTEAARAALGSIGCTLGEADVLDVGCGTGDWLAGLAEFGAEPKRLTGVELLIDRLREGKRRRPGARLVGGSGWSLPFRDESFDLLCLFTVLSSLPSPADREALGAEVRRVLRPGRHVLVYDFRVKRPGATELVGIGAKEVLGALGGELVWRRSLTLAPPIARALGRFGWRGVLVAERILPIFRTHRMYLVRAP